MKNGKQKKKVLVVDDEKQLVEILCDELTLRGFEPLAAYDGTSALNLIQTKNPDAIISDYTMPGLNGMDLLDLMEMMADWKASTLRNKDGDISKSLEINKKRFGISDQLFDILNNTINRYLK
jgi:DNA-binding response OmpR family regulator